jgi:AcrR family transcriptional regulator/transcriptional regulator with XRE-family HTH domain
MDTSDFSDIGVVIRTARSVRGLSLRALAHAIDVSPATLSAIENGKTGISLKRLHTLATGLGTTIDKLLRGDAQEDAKAHHESPLGSISLDRDQNGWRHYAPLNIDPMLSAAIAAFVETGYHGATMRYIAGLAGISVPGLYHHYASKQELLVRILDLTMSELLWRVPAARDEGGDSVQRVALMVECLALCHTHHRELAFLGASEMRSLEPANRRRIAALRSDIQHMVDTEIAAGIANGQFLTQAPRNIGRAISTMCTSLPQWFRADGPLTPESIAKEYTTFALGMLICIESGPVTARLATE